MTRAEAKNILLKEFINNYSETPYSLMNNDNFEKPDNSPWVRFFVKNNDVEQVSYGPKPHRRFGRMGSVKYQVFLPINTGTFVGDNICEQINDIFEGERFGDIICKEGTWSETGINKDGWFQFNGRVYYEFDQLK